jgi:hypothetical protein
MSLGKTIASDSIDPASDINDPATLILSNPIAVPTNSVIASSSV